MFTIKIKDYSLFPKNEDGLIINKDIKMILKSSESVNIDIAGVVSFGARFIENMLLDVPINRVNILNIDSNQFFKRYFSELKSEELKANSNA